MPVSPREKDAFRDSAHTWNNAAAGFTIVGGATALWAPPAAAVACMCSGVSWLMGNRAARLAADPPRSDVFNTSLYRAVDPALFPPLREPLDSSFGPVLFDVLVREINLSNALNCLLQTYERELFIDQVPTGSVEVRAISLQSNALLHNLRACQKLHLEISEAAPLLNLAYIEQRPRLAALVAEERGPIEAYMYVAEVLHRFPQLASMYGLADPEVVRFEGAVLFEPELTWPGDADPDKLGHTPFESSRLPEVIFDDRWFRAIWQVSERLSEAYAERLSAYQLSN